MPYAMICAMTQLNPMKSDKGLEPDRKDDLVAEGMAQWQQARADIDCSGKAVVGRMLLLDELIVQKMNDALAHHGIKYYEYAVLATLRVMGPPFRMTPSALKRKLLFTSGGLSNLLKRLEQSGWIRRADDPEDGRGVLVHLTPKGRRLADESMQDQARAELELLHMFSPSEQQLLAGMLARMLSGNSARSPRL